jgi:hypothetical protein
VDVRLVGVAWSGGFVSGCWILPGTAGVSRKRTRSGRVWMSPRPCTHGNIRARLASAKWDETPVVARASVSEWTGQRCSPLWSGGDSLFSSRVFQGSTTLGAAASVGGSSHKTHERKKRYAARTRRRVSFSAGHHHRRPCDHGSLVLLRRRKTSPYVPVRAGTFNPQHDRSPRYVSVSDGPSSDLRGRLRPPTGVLFGRTRSRTPGQAGVHSPCTHGSIRARLASAKWDETSVAARASVSGQTGQRCSPLWSGGDSLFSSRVFQGSTTLGAAASVGGSSHKTHERKKRYAACARRRVSFTAGHHHGRPCDLGSLVLLRRRGMSAYVPVRARIFHPGTTVARDACLFRTDRSSDLRGRLRPPTVSVPCGHARGLPVRLGFTVPARTGAYGLVLRRRSGTRRPWWQGRLCPSRGDSAASRCGPAVIRFFHPGFFRGQQPSELRPPRVALPIKSLI